MASQGRLLLVRGDFHGPEPVSASLLSPTTQHFSCRAYILRGHDVSVARGRDTFWILKGLLVSGMQHTACNMVRNLIRLAATHGYVPNGMRCYYLNRSQPPLLSAMVRLVLDATGNDSLLEDAYPVRAEQHNISMPHRRRLQPTIGVTCPRLQPSDCCLTCRLC